MIGTVHWTMQFKRRENAPKPITESIAMHTTRIALSEKIRKKVTPILADRLTDAIDLSLQLKQAHWNIKGPHFVALHELFDSIHGVVSSKVDDLAERLTALGDTADGTVHAVAKRSGLPAYSPKITRGEDHLEAVATALATFGGLTRTAIDTCDEAGDKVTADLFNEITAEVDQQLWFVEAHLQR
jgi:starvation-inducible DNA-binding protein